MTRKVAVSAMLVSGIFAGLVASQGAASADDYVPGITGVYTPPQPGMVPAGIYPSWDACQTAGKDGFWQGRWKVDWICWRLTEDNRMLWVTPV